MKGLLSGLAVGGIGVLAFLSVGLASPAFATTTTTIIGWLAPDGAHFNSGIPVLMWAMLGVALFTIVGRAMDLHGDVVVTLALLGLVLGSLMGMLSLGNSTIGNSLPFALPVVAGADLVLWLWQGGGK